MGFLLAGVAAGAISRLWATRPNSETVALRHAVADLEARVAQLDAAHEQRLEQLETRIDRHETQLQSMPTTEQIVSAMQELIGRTMLSLDRRLTTQAESIELLKTTVTQTDGLLEKVLESLDSLRHDYVPAASDGDGEGPSAAF